MNRGNATEITLDVPQFADGMVFTDALDNSYQAFVENSKLTISLDKSQARILINQ
jgi:hypothetical protein